MGVVLFYREDFIVFGDVFDFFDWRREGVTGILCVDARDIVKYFVMYWVVFFFF